MYQILSPPPTTTFSNSLGHLAFPNSHNLAQRLSFCICRRNPGEYKNTSHSHTKRSFSGVSISRLTVVANVCVRNGSNVQVTRWSFIQIPCTTHYAQVPGTFWSSHIMYSTIFNAFTVLLPLYFSNETMHYEGLTVPHTVANFQGQYIPALATLGRITTEGHKYLWPSDVM